MAGGAGWAAAAKAGADLVNAAYTARVSTDLSKFQTQFASDTNVINRTREDNRMQRAVADAKAAGLHPLFALGSAGAGSASISLGPTPTGSYAGTGISRAGEAIGQGITQHYKDKRTGRLDAAAAELHSLRVTKAQKEIQLDDAQLMKMASDLKLSEQQNLYWGGGAQTFPLSGGGPESMLQGYRSRAGLPLNQSPIVNRARESIPAFMEMKGPAGRRMIRNPEIGDELAEVDTAVRPWWDTAESYWNRHKFRPKGNNPAAYYYYWKNYYRKKGKR